MNGAFNDIIEIKKCKNIMIDINSNLFSYIKAKIKSKKILKRLNTYDIFELCFAYIAYNTAKYEIYDEKFMHLVSNKILLNNTCLKVLDKDFTLTFRNGTFNVYMSYKYKDINGFSISKDINTVDRINKLWEPVSEVLRNELIIDIIYSR